MPCKYTANSKLQEVLVLGKKSIGDRGAECLANALAKNSTLRELFLDDNEIDDRGAEYFANVFATNSTLLELDLYLHNNIGDRRAAMRRITSDLKRTKLCRIKSHLKRKKNANKNKSALVAICGAPIMSHQHQNHLKQEAEDAVLAEVVEDSAEGSV